MSQEGELPPKVWARAQALLEPGDGGQTISARRKQSGHRRTRSECEATDLEMLRELAEHRHKFRDNSPSPTPPVCVAKLDRNTGSALMVEEERAAVESPRSARTQLLLSLPNDPALLRDLGTKSSSSKLNSKTMKNAQYLTKPVRGAKYQTKSLPSRKKGALLAGKYQDAAQDRDEKLMEKLEDEKHKGSKWWKKHFHISGTASLGRSYGADRSYSKSHKRFNSSGDKEVDGDSHALSASASGTSIRFFKNEKLLSTPIKSGKGAHKRSKSDQGARARKLFFKIALEEGEKVCQVSKIKHPALTMIEFLSTVAPLTQGVFRIAGSAPEVSELCSLLDDGQVQHMQLESYSVHAVAAATKQFYRELPSAIFPAENFESFVNLYTQFVEGKIDLKEYDMALQNHVKNELDSVRQTHLHHLLTMLAAVATRAETNKMNPSNLAVVWAPNLFVDKLSSNVNETLKIIAATTSIVERLIHIQLNHVKLDGENTQAAQALPEDTQPPVAP